MHHRTKESKIVSILVLFFPIWLPSRWPSSRCTVPMQRAKKQFHGNGRDSIFGLCYNLIPIQQSNPAFEISLPQFESVSPNMFPRQPKKNQLRKFKFMDVNITDFDFYRLLFENRVYNARLYFSLRKIIVLILYTSLKSHDFH